MAGFLLCLLFYYQPSTAAGIASSPTEWGRFMKLRLVVLNPGRMEGRSIPIALPEFLIGRDPQCHLRPTSPLISKRHCALLVKGDKVFVRDFQSTNGTLVNDHPIHSECELRDQDRLKVGPLEFRLVKESEVVASRPTPLPESGGATTAPLDDAAAAMLLALPDDTDTARSAANVDSEGVPTGTTIMELPAAQPGTPLPGTGKAVDKEEAAKKAAGNTSSAAKAILEKYLRRPRQWQPISHLQSSASRFVEHFSIGSFVTAERSPGERTEILIGSG
jgi:pSer/pThr/pTyr-binding forkhead associated (FHA) protein